MTSIELRNLSKVYDGGVVGVSDFDLTVRSGEFLVLVGPSGCGKSTTLELVAGLQFPTEGTVHIGDEDVSSMSPRDRGVAMVFQNYALYPHKTVQENLEFGLKYTTDLSADQREQRAVETAELLEISHLLNKKPKELSGGQQQRVALGRAIIRDPEVFLMDEPLSNLDAKLRTSMRAELQRLQHDLDITTLYVTHDQVEAMTMGDRIAVLNDGELQQVGSPTELYNDPANTFVAGFIGSPSMNFVDGTLGDNAFHSESFSYEFEGSLPIDLDGTSVTLGIRPEDVQINGGHGGGVVQATVQVVEKLGNENFLHLAFGDEEFTARADEQVAPGIDEIVTIGFPESRVYLFDEDGNTLLSRHPEETDAPHAVPGHSPSE